VYHCAAHDLMMVLCLMTKQRVHDCLCIIVVGKAGYTKERVTTAVHMDESAFPRNCLCQPPSLWHLCMENARLTS
jgi:hypothetical protein